MDFDFDLEQITPVNTTSLIINGTGALTIPIGTTGEQPGTPVDGMIRYNTTTAKFEGREAGAWENIIGAAAGLNNVVEDLTPQLGGNLDVNGFEITAAGTDAIILRATGTSDVELHSADDIQLTATSHIELTGTTIRVNGTIVSAPVGSNNNLTLTPDGTGDLVLDGINWPQADGSPNQILETDGAGQLSFVTPSSGGPTFADDVFRVTGSVDATKLLAFEVDGLTTATTRTITMPDQDIDLTPSSGTFAASSTTITAGAGMTGGGDLSANRTLDVVGGEGITANADDIELDYTVATVTAVAGDFIQISDASNAGAVRKVDASDFLSGGGAPTTAQYVTMALDATLTAERVLTGGSGITLTDGGANGNATLDLDINSLATETTIAAGDFVPFWDITATATNKKITFANFEAGIDASLIDASAFGANEVIFSTGSVLSSEADFTYDAATNVLALTGTFDLVHTATTINDHAKEVDVDAAGFGDVKAIDVVYTTGAIGAGDDEAVILANIDESAATGGTIAGLEILATEGLAEIFGLFVGVNVNPIEQLSGAFGNMDSALVNAVDRLTEFTTAGSDVQMFVADNDTVTIGDAAKFQEIEFLLAVVASGSGIAPTFEYSTGVGTWATFTPVDGTNGMTNNGVIAWLNTDIPSWAVGTGSEFLIRITRTRNTLTTPPTESKVQIAVATEYSWNKDGDLTVRDISARDIVVSGLVDGVDIAAHVADGTIHFTEASIDHTAITNIGTNTHAQIDTHIADGTIHFTEASIDHTAITNIGTNTHAQIDTHIADGTIHFTEASIDHTAITNIGTNTHAQIDTHIADATLHNTPADNAFRITGSADATKLLAFEVDGLTTATTRTITMPDQNIDLTPSSGDFAASSTTITAGAGLTGGGDLSANRTIDVGAGSGIAVNADDVALDINSLATETTIAAGDFVPFWDITATATNKKITFANFEATLNHDSLAGFVADEHVAHTGVVLTAGTGLTGGGDISASRTFDVVGGEGITANADDIELDYTVATVTAVAGDFIQISDTSNAGAVRKVDASDFLNGSDTLAAVQARRTTAYTLTTAFVDITFDTTDEETDAAVVEHNNTNTDDIDVKEVGTYLIRYESDTETAAAANNTNIQMEARVRLNDTSVLPGSEAMVASFEDNSVAGSEGPQHLSNAFIATLAASDKVTLQLSKVEISGTTTYTAERISFQVIKLEGVQGPTGATGATGSGSNITLEDEDVAVTNTPHSTLNFTGAGVTVTDAGSGQADITIPGGSSVAAVQARRTTTFSPTAAFQDITLDATDLENDALVVEHDNTNTDRINLISAGLYRISARADFDAPTVAAEHAEVQLRVRVNDTTVINGSDTEGSVFNDSSIEGNTFTMSLSSECLYQATANDFITMQIQHVVIAGTPDETTRAGGVVLIATRLGD